MTLTTHVTIGAIIGIGLQNPVLGFTMGFISHFLVDVIPHGDHFLSNDFRIHKKVKIPVLYTATDAITGILVLTTLVATASFNHLETFIAAIVGSILPDILVGLHELSRGKHLKRFNRVHFIFHDFLVHRYGDVSLRLSIGLQSLFVVLTLLFLP